MKIDSFRFHLIMGKILPQAKKEPYYSLIQYNVYLNPDVSVGFIYADHSDAIWGEIRNNYLLQDGSWIRPDLDSFEKSLVEFSVAFDDIFERRAGYQSLRIIYKKLISNTNRA